MVECEICKQEIKKGQKFIMIGTYLSKLDQIKYQWTKGTVLAGAGLDISDFGITYRSKYLVDV